MNVITCTRKDVIQAYVKYDARKKNRSVPTDFADWQWSDPNALDSKLREHGFKPGIIAGYKTWQTIELRRLDLRNCAVQADIFPKGFPRALSDLINFSEFKIWKPKTATSPEWYEHLESGGTFPDDWALILRPALRSETPAKWYIEDGSGRAICFLRRLENHPEENGVAMAYLGVEPDSESAFMKQKFLELLPGSTKDRC